MSTEDRSPKKKEPPTLLMIYMGFFCELVGAIIGGNRGLTVQIIGLFAALTAIWFLIESRTR